MRRYRLEIDNVRSHLRSLWAVIGLQGLIILALWVGWSQAPKQLRVYVPPDLRSGAVLAAEEVPAANVYAFAFYIFQQLNRWPENGATDYGSAIFRISPYLTPRYRNDLIEDMELKARRGELAYRVRGVHEVPGHGYEERRVDVLSSGAWIVWLDLDLMESVKGMTVKQTTIRYPIRVVRQAIDPETNPWGMALDGYGSEGPRRLTDAELAAPGAKGTSTEEETSR
ncbi:PFL_4703 family integrating conjugative element protein [Congregibacter litoralis]|uniref:Integrating conjugative element protein family n=1 Tax=Congregibacter litoralis KT71 TaxID=314285 RepID=A4A4F3_9GAMM|nr:TIGR03746 family integrating conjugative element protein [Congregibacter litoralis]EAQ99576.1 integrating conjugative element protein family [Congregibacter litoralis KT71]